MGDAGNGAAGKVIRRLVNRLPGDHLVLNSDIDGTFPSHHPDPSVPENLDQLISAVVENSCDLVLALTATEIESEWSIIGGRLFGQISY